MSAPIEYIAEDLWPLFTHKNRPHKWWRGDLIWASVSLANWHLVLGGTPNDPTVVISDLAVGDTFWDECFVSNICLPHNVIEVAMELAPNDETRELWLVAFAIADPITRADMVRSVPQVMASVDRALFAKHERALLTAASTAPLPTGGKRLGRL